MFLLLISVLPELNNSITQHCFHWLLSLSLLSWPSVKLESYQFFVFLATWLRRTSGSKRSWLKGPLSLFLRRPLSPWNHPSSAVGLSLYRTCDFPLCQMTSWLSSHWLGAILSSLPFPQALWIRTIRWFRAGFFFPDHPVSLNTTLLTQRNVGQKLNDIAELLFLENPFHTETLSVISVCWNKSWTLQSRFWAWAKNCADIFRT